MDNYCAQDLKSELDANGRAGTHNPSLGNSVRRSRILVVEDDRHIARLLEYILRRAGYDVRVAHSAENGLAEMMDRRPDALLLDLVLPGMTGLEFLRTIRAAPYFSECVVIVLTAHWVEQAKSTLVEAGASAQCSKPIAPSTLLRKLRDFGVNPSTSAEAPIPGEQ